MSEAFLPVRRPSNISAFVQQFDAVEVQHEGIGHKESPLGFPSALEFLSGFRHGINQGALGGFLEAEEMRRDALPG